LKQSSLEEQQYVNDQRDLKEKLSSIFYQIKDIDTNLQATDNYLEKYIPFRIQNFISENLENALSLTQFRHFQNFERKKYKQMHQVILKDEGDFVLNKTFKGPIRSSFDATTLNKNSIVVENTKTIPKMIKVDEELLIIAITNKKRECSVQDDCHQEL